MKVLYFFPYDGSFMTEWQKVQIFSEMEHYGVKFEIFNPLSYSSYDEANEALIRKLRGDSSVDLFMNCTGSKSLFKETMEEISSLPIPKLLFCPDNLHSPFMHKDIAPYYDLVWLTSRETEPIFKKWGCKTVFQPYASNPYAFKDLFQKQIDRVCFIGTPYGTRTTTFNRLACNSLNVDVFCKSINKEPQVELKTNDRYPSFTDIYRMLSFSIGRKVIYGKIKSSLVRMAPLIESEHLRLLHKVSFEEMNIAYSNYALCLNIISLRNTAVLKKPVQKLHLRTFEIPMACGLEIVEYNEELSNYFSDTEMVFYKNNEEMIDKARFFLNPRNSSVCREMKINARKRAINEHGWMNRFSVIFDQLDLKYNKHPDMNLL